MKNIIAVFLSGIALNYGYSIIEAYQLHFWKKILAWEILAQSLLIAVSLTVTYLVVVSLMTGIKLSILGAVSKLVKKE